MNTFNKRIEELFGKKTYEEKIKFNKDIDETKIEDLLLSYRSKIKEVIDTNRRFNPTWSFLSKSFGFTLT